MKKSIVTMLAVLAVMASIASPAFAYESSYDDGTGLTRYEKTMIATSEKALDHFPAIYRVAREAGDFAGMEEALNAMEDAIMYLDSIFGSNIDN